MNKNHYINKEKILQPSIQNQTNKQNTLQKAMQAKDTNTWSDEESASSQDTDYQIQVTNNITANNKTTEEMYDIWNEEMNITKKTNSQNESNKQKNPTRPQWPRIRMTDYDEESESTLDSDYQIQVTNNILIIDETTKVAAAQQQLKEQMRSIVTMNSQTIHIT